VHTEQRQQPQKQTKQQRTENKKKNV